MVRELQCPKCQVSLPVDNLRPHEFVPCPGCTTPLRAIAFPALQHQPIAAEAEAVVIAGDASCFFHATKRANATCDQCGRFICALCEVEVRGQKLCPTCVTLGRSSGELAQLETSRARWDSRCLNLALVPLLFWPVTVLTAPAVLILAVKFWRAPGGLVEPSKWRFGVAVLFALLEIVGCAAFVVALVSGSFN